MRRFIMLAGILIAAVLGGNAQTTDPAYVQKLASLYKGTVPIVMPAAFQSMLQAGAQPKILDTRSPREFQVSHIKGAQFVEYSKFNKNVAKDWDHQQPVVVYCTVGYRSERIGEQLKKLGFTHVYNLYGGIFEWVNQGNPIVDDNEKPTEEVHAYSEDWGQWLLKGKKIYK